MPFESNSLPDDDMHGAPAHYEQEPITVVSGKDVYLGDADDEEAEKAAAHNLEVSRSKAKRLKNMKIAAACAVVCGLIAIVAGRFMFAKADTDEVTAPETVAVERKDFEATVKATGKLKAGSTVMVTPEIDGIIESVKVSEGQTVKEGDVLFTIKNDTLEKEVQSAQRELTAAQNALNSAQDSVSRAQASRDEAWARYDQQWAEADARHAEWASASNNYAALHEAWEHAISAARELYPEWSAGAPPKPTPPSDDATEEEFNDYGEAQARYDAWQSYCAAMEAVGDEPQPAGTEPTYPDAPDDVSLQNAVATAQEAVTTANSNLEKAQAALKDAEEKAEKRTVKAPAGGSVVAVGAKVGAAVTSGTNASSSQSSSDKALVQISDASRMEIDAEVNEIDIMAIKKGQSATVTYSAVSDVTSEALVDEVASVASNKSDDSGSSGVVTFHVGLTIPRPDDQLRAGMTANANITTANEKNVLVVPVSSVREEGQTATVEVVVDDNPESFETVPRQVKLGNRSSSEVIVTDGLTAGELILVNVDGEDAGEE